MTFLEDMQKRYPRHVRIGKVTGQVRLSGPAYEELREYIWSRDHGKCIECGCLVVLEKGYWITMHPAHIKSKGSGGDDLPYNMRSLCLRCHAAEHAGKDVSKGANATRNDSQALDGVTVLDGIRDGF